jgi:hypothetical protein
MSDSIFIYMLVIHFLADFGLQTDEQAKGKSTRRYHLFNHCAVYSAIWFLASYVLLNDWVNSFVFAAITFGFHFITDLFTSRIGKMYWDEADYHNGFVVVGFDQVLHYIQLYYTLVLILPIELTN